MTDQRKPNEAESAKAVNNDAVVPNPNTRKPTPFTVLSNLIALNYQSGKHKGRKTLIERKSKHEHKHKSNSDLPIDLNNNLEPDKSTFETSSNSIQAVLNGCHKDIRRFLDRTNITYLKASAGTLTLRLNTGMTIVIGTLTKEHKHYKVIDEKKRVLLDIQG